MALVLRRRTNGDIEAENGWPDIHNMAPQTLLRLVQGNFAHVVVTFAAADGEHRYHITGGELEASGKVATLSFTREEEGPPADPEVS